MAENLVVLDGSTFFVSERSGDIEPRGDASGFFFADMRHLSTWRLRINGAPIRVLTSRTVDYYSARVIGTLASARVGRNPSISIQRHRFVSDGFHEELIIENHGQKAEELLVELDFGADFTDLFEVKDPRPKRGMISIETETERASLWYEREDFRRGTVLTFEGLESLEPACARFLVRLERRQRWQTCIDVSCVADGRIYAPGLRCGSFSQPKPKMPRTLEQWLEDAPRLKTSLDALQHAYRQSLVDLAALRFRPREDLSWSLPAAGLPWFMALFGRDSLIASYQALPFQPHLAQTTLHGLAAMQATESDAFTDADPGKILHELRCGELAWLGEVPHRPYYGSHDATLLFLIVLDEYLRWSGDLDLVRRLEPAARAALAWMEGPGDLDGDGYLEYQTRSSKGLRNQGWKDSWNSMLFADGRLAEPPIATCDIQGYAYDARLRMARLARLAWHDEPLAARLEKDAGALKKRFNRDFWHAERAHYVLALDKDKRQVDALTSNVGHLLWSGIVDPDRAAVTVRRLMARDMFSGWGVRTMSSQDAGYNPIEYHNGTVWPHDSGLIAEGFRRYGFREEASQLALAVVEAAAFFEGRLPEVFAGFAREEIGFPAEYPTASRPQAWSAGATLLALRTLLGLDVGEDHAVRSVPHLPEPVGDLRLLGVPAGGRRWDVPDR